MRSLFALTTTASSDSPEARAASGAARTRSASSVSRTTVTSWSESVSGRRSPLAPTSWTVSRQRQSTSSPRSMRQRHRFSSPCSLAAGPLPSSRAGPSRPPAHPGKRVDACEQRLDWRLPRFVPVDVSNPRENVPCADAVVVGKRTGARLSCGPGAGEGSVASRGGRCPRPSQSTGCGHRPKAPSGS